MMYRVLPLLASLAILISGTAEAVAAEKKLAPALKEARVLPRVPYRVDVLGVGTPMHGIQGITLGPDGALYAGSVMGRSIYRIDIASGAITTFLGPPRALADDLAFGPDGTLVWSQIAEGAVYARGKGGTILRLAQNMAGVNAVAFSPEGRLFVSRVVNGDGLYEIDLNGAAPPRVVVENIGGLNAFQFVDDRTIYGPLMSSGKVVRVDVETGEISDVATGFALPTSVRIEADGNLIVLEYLKGEVTRVDPKTGGKTLLATLPPMADNCILGKDGTIYVSSTAHNGITAIDPKTAAQRRITWSDFAAPGLLTLADVGGTERLLVADAWTPRFVDAAGKVELVTSEHILLGPTAIAVRGGIYVMTFNNIPGMDPSVQVIERATGKVLVNLTNFGSPYGVEFLPDGFVVADFAVGRLTKVGNDPAHTRTTLAWGFDGPLGLADAGEGVFYVSEHRGGRITRVDTNTNNKRTLIGGLKAPEGIALARDGRLIVAEVGERRVLGVDIATGQATILADQLEIGLAMGSSSAPFLPTGVAVGKDGTIYVPSDIKNVMYRLTPPMP